MITSYSLSAYKFSLEHIWIYTLDGSSHTSFNEIIQKTLWEIMSIETTLPCN